MIKPRSKIFFQTKENIFNNKKTLKLKKKKWRFFKKKNNLQRPESLKKIYKQKLLEKQKFKSFYGNLFDYQLKNIFLLLKKKNSLNIIQDLCIFLEKRLDVTLFRMGLVPSIFESKNLINQKKIFVNNKLINSINYNLKPGDIIFINQQDCKIKNLIIPPYIEWNKNLNLFIFIRNPKINEIVYPFNINLNLVFKCLNNK